MTCDFVVRSWIWLTLICWFIYFYYRQWQWGGTQLTSHSQPLCVFLELYNLLLLLLWWNTKLLFGQLVGTWIFLLLLMLWVSLSLSLFPSSLSFYALNNLLNIYYNWYLRFLFLFLILCTGYCVIRHCLLCSRAGDAKKRACLCNRFQPSDDDHCCNYGLFPSCWKDICWRVIIQLNPFFFFFSFSY